MNEISERSQIHAMFVIERDLDAPLDRVWHPLSDSDACDQWFSGGPTFDIEGGQQTLSKLAAYVTEIVRKGVEN